jgi:hypothetical protein
LETAAVLCRRAVPTGRCVLQDLFRELTSGHRDDGQVSLEEDVLSLEGPGLFGNLDG